MTFLLLLFCETWIYKGYIIKFVLYLLSLALLASKKSIDFFFLFLTIKKQLKLSSSKLLYSKRGYTLQFMPIIKSLELDLINNFKNNMCSMNHVIFRIKYLVYNLVFKTEIRLYIKIFNAALCVVRQHGKLKHMTKTRIITCYGVQESSNPWRCRQFYSSSHDENTYYLIINFLSTISTYFF